MPRISRPDFTKPVAPEVFLEWLLDNVWVAPTGCWFWLGSDSGIEGRGAGYGKTRLALGTGSKTKWGFVHRLSYHFLVGAVPAGHQVDHKCKHWFWIEGTDPIVYRRCCNPDHLEPLIQSDNIKRNRLGASYAQPNLPIGC